MNWCNKASSLFFFTQNITVLFSWTCWETLCYVNCKMLAFSFFGMVRHHISFVWCVTAYMPTFQVNGWYDLAHSVTPKKSWLILFFWMRLCNGHCICQMSWQSEGFATQKHDGSSNSYSCIAEKDVVRVLSHTKTYVVLHWTDSFVKLDVDLCVIIYYITRTQSSFSDTVLGILLWLPEYEMPPPPSIFSFQDGTYMEHIYLCEQ